MKGMWHGSVGTLCHYVINMPGLDTQLTHIPLKLKTNEWQWPFETIRYSVMKKKMSCPFGNDHHCLRKNDYMYFFSAIALDTRAINSHSYTAVDLVAFSDLEPLAEENWKRRVDMGRAKTTSTMATTLRSSSFISYWANKVDTCGKVLFELCVEVQMSAETLIRCCKDIRKKMANAQCQKNNVPKISIARWLVNVYFMRMSRIHSKKVFISSEMYIKRKMKWYPIIHWISIIGVQLGERGPGKAHQVCCSGKIAKKKTQT